MSRCKTPYWTAKNRRNCAQLRKNNSVKQQQKKNSVKVKSDWIGRAPTIRWPVGRNGSAVYFDPCANGAFFLALLRLKNQKKKEERKIGTTFAFHWPLGWHKKMFLFRPFWFGNRRFADVNGALLRGPTGDSKKKPSKNSVINVPHRWLEIKKLGKKPTWGGFGLPLKTNGHQPKKNEDGKQKLGKTR